MKNLEVSTIRHLLNKYYSASERVIKSRSSAERKRAITELQRIQTQYIEAMRA